MGLGRGRRCGKEVPSAYGDCSDREPRLGLLAPSRFGVSARPVRVNPPVGLIRPGWLIAGSFQVHASDREAQEIFNKG